MAAPHKKSFRELDAQERDLALHNLDREILLEDTKPLSPKGQLLWQRAQAANEPIPPEIPSADEAVQLLSEAKNLARRYYNLTGRPLGVTGEVAEFEAIRILGLKPALVRQAGYDALRSDGMTTSRIQIKGRCIQGVGPISGRLGRIQMRHDWDSVLLVLLDRNFDATEMHEAEREAVKNALMEPGSRSRNEHGALSIQKFKSIGRLVWKRPA